MKLDAHWMPFTANKAFKANPRMLASASGMYWTSGEGARILDMTAGLWCSNLGHGRESVARAMYEASVNLDYAPSFGFGHDASFTLAERLAALAPGDLNHVFFTNSGSESVDTALKMAIAYQSARGLGSKRMFISRERAYHGVNMGGTTVGGITTNTRTFGRWAPVDHLHSTLDIERNAFSKGLPDFGADRAEELEQLILLHGAENIAGVIVEPIAGAGGVIIPPKGYLKRLREICDAHDVLLILDEVVCGFGRTGSFTAGIEFDILPDLFTVAKGLTSGTVPMGAVFCRSGIHDTIMASAEGIEFFHGYTYSAHPIACAAAHACLDIYEEEGLFTRVNEGIGKYFEHVLHNLKDLPEIIDIRNYGLLGAIEFADQGSEAPVGVRVFQEAWKQGVMLRGLGNIVVMSPPLVAEESHIDEFAEKIWRSIRTVTEEQRMTA
ncbi:aminotransferase class III-fold pyridoxal phosphate-dependent enzyme [Parahaliea mediterranea]|uniref:Aminotransferase class III-fold pyridoxal phosphate-dependent enzyme n=1 Tax=Parahaliea mediterranea TaxID=651086 RepID=A0A939DF15_9GAMM|nr:aminotransferase class III-fold pyridoxal phosphate-dependent enzyme [Parahaliea mediterranea]MBN7796869.1 aminotransferase class III-fold pyridoxal phosphate-dependent enzyme [Parahaliea mediterranea]